MANPTTNYGFVLPTSSDLVTDLPADFDVALQGVDTQLKALNPSTTEGDIEYRSSTANTNSRLAIGTAGQVLQVNSGATAPEWATPAGGGGKVLQVISVLYGTETTTTSSSYASTGLSATITPTLATSQILAIVNMGNVKCDGVSSAVDIRLRRDTDIISVFGVQVAISDVAGGNVRSAGSASITVLDSPASTSALDYNVQFRRTTTCTGTIQGNSSNSSITLLEIGA